VRHLTRLLLLYAALALAACSGVETMDELPKTDGLRHPLLGAPHVSVVVPKGLDVVQPLTWLWQTEDGPILLTVRREQEPADGMNAGLDREIRALEQGGQAELADDRAVQLGDLEGRVVEATTVRKDQPPTSAWLMVCVAEDGMYVLTVAGPASAIKDRRPELLAFIESLRIASPADRPSPPPQAPVPDLVEPPTAVTPP